MPTSLAPEVADKVASNVRIAVTNADLTQTGLAVILGMSQQAVSAKLAGKTPFTVDELVCISAALKVRLESLLIGVAS